jgi:hypothetical protein
LWAGAGRIAIQESEFQGFDTATSCRTLITILMIKSNTEKAMTNPATVIRIVAW